MFVLSFIFGQNYTNSFTVILACTGAYLIYNNLYLHIIYIFDLFDTSGCALAYRDAVFKVIKRGQQNSLKPNKDKKKV